MVETIKGGIPKDHRGNIKFVNDFDMSLVKRFYIISNADTELVRGWRAHRIEQRWFYVLAGSFAMEFVEIEDWENTPTDSPVQSQVLNASDLSVLHMPTGYALAFKALAPNSQLLVYSDYGIKDAAKDDYVFPVDYFINSKI